MKRWLLVGAALAALAAAGVGVAAWRYYSTEPPPAPVVIPPSFAQASRSPGHVAHVVAEKIACRECHAISRGGELGEPTPDRCADCHPKLAVSVHSSSASEEARACQSCHGFAAASERRLDDCISCHDGDEMPPLGKHREKCTGCHRPHGEPSLQPLPCADCHQQTASHGRGEDKGAAQCLSCHRSHELAVAARTACDRCHRSDDPRSIAAASARIPAAATFAGHDRCDTCHPPHQATAAAARPCTSCHADRGGPLSGTGSPHAKCQSCHPQHAPRQIAACISCHRDERADHPPPRGSQGACEGCHPIHRRPGVRLATRRGGAALECRACHQSTASHAAGLACASCHQPHQIQRPRLVGVALCADCHKTEVRTTAATGHATCTACHASPGHAASRAPPACATCHAKQTGEVASGHRDCAGCHRAARHAPRAPVAACATCHAAENRTAPVGHRACASCHQPHAGTRMAECASCHASEKKARHGSLDGGCQSCHRPHGPGGKASPPGCLTCHSRAKLPGLHSAGGHDRCAACHDSHETAAKSDRASCAACHQNLEQHEPNARSCRGCHPFGG